MEIAVALNTEEKSEAIKWIETLKDEAELFKVGLPLYLRYGPSLIYELKSLGVRIFLDLKLFDIPEVIKKAVKVVSELEVELLTVSTLGGYEMMKAAREAGGGKLRILGVTILTSIDEKYLRERIGIDVPVEELVLKLAKEAIRAGLDGVVASGREIEILRKNLGDDVLIVVPGVRIEEDIRGDQKRVITPEEAGRLGADIIVVGRPITHSSNPKEKIRIYREKMKGGKYGS